MLPSSPEVFKASCVHMTEQLMHACFGQQRLTITARVRESSSGHSNTSQVQGGAAHFL